MTEHQQMVEDCEKRESKLSTWEVEFIDSLSMRLAIGKSLTEKQAERLNQIWDRATNNG
jgi:hypothetical protein